MKITQNEKFLELKLYNGSSYIEVFNKDRQNYAIKEFILVKILYDLIYKNLD